MIQIENLTKSFGQKTVLDSVNLSFEEGTISFVLGKSGVGKSVLLKHIVGLLSIDVGEIYVDGVALKSLSEERMTEIRKKCGMVFQFPALLDSLSIYENIVFGLRAHHPEMPEGERQEMVLQKLKQVHLSESILEKYPGEVSFGEQKRVSIARTLAVNPKYLLFDEPTTSLDPITTNALTQLIKDLSRELCLTSIVVSHDLDSAFKIADRLILLSEGKTVVDGSLADFGNSAHPLARDFLREMESFS